MMKTKQLLTTAFLVLISSMLLATGKVRTPGTSDTWELAATKGEVSLFYKVDQCGNNEVLLLKVVNKGTAPVTVRWQETILSENEILNATGSTGQDGFKEIFIGPMETIEGSCDLSMYAELSESAPELFPKDEAPHFMEYHVDSIITQ